MPEYDQAVNEDPEVSPTSELQTTETTQFDALPAEVSDDTSSATAPPSENIGEIGEQTDDTATASDVREKFIPRERFDEVNNELKTIRDQKAAYDEWFSGIQREAREVYGVEVKTHEDYKALDAWVRQTRQAEAESARLKLSYDQQVEQGLLTPAEAEAYQRAELAETRAAAVEQQRLQFVQQQQAQAYAQQVDQTLTSLAAKYPDMDAETVKLKHYAGQGDLAALAEASHKAINARVQREIAAYAAGKSKTASRPAPEGSGGNAPPKPSQPDGSDPAKFFAWMDEQARQTDRARGY